MIRHTHAPRRDWQETVTTQGLVFITDPYAPDPNVEWNSSPWSENASWEFSRDEIIVIESVSSELYQMCLKAVDHCVQNPEWMTRMGIPPVVQQTIVESWQQRHPSVYARFDLARAANGNLKMIEINGDTPTGLVESSLIQWHWLEDVHPELARAPEPGQFNSIHEALKLRWELIHDLLPADDRSAVFSTITDATDDFITTEYMRDLATQAGFETHLCDIRNITLYENTNGTRAFGTPDQIPLRTWFKLYPWEWLMTEEFGLDLLAQRQNIRVLEPAWKILLSHKAILVVLWEMFAGHPNLVPAFFEQHSSLKDNYVIKPQYGRESTGVRMIRNGLELGTPSSTPNPLGHLPPVYQSLIDIAPQQGYFPLIGSWMVDEEPVGMMIREDSNRIIAGESRIVPHFYR